MYRLIPAIVLAAAAAARQTPPNHQNLPNTAFNVGSLAVTWLSSPVAAPTVTATCFSGCTRTWSYAVADCLPDGTGIAGSTAGSTTTGAATLNSSAFNTVIHVCAGTWEIIRIDGIRSMAGGLDMGRGWPDWVDGRRPRR